MERYGIDMTELEIQNMSKRKFRKLVYESVEKYALSKLIDTAKSQSKCQSILKNINENNFQIQKYLVCDSLIREEQLTLFSLRSFTFPVKSNYKYLFKSDMKCRGCKNETTIENESHLINFCSLFNEERCSIGTLDHEHIFGTLDEQISFIKRFKIIARKWKLILENKTTTI